MLLDYLYLDKQLYGLEEEDKWNVNHIIAIALISYTGLIACCVGCMSGYHGKLACYGATTNEEMRGKYDGGLGNPYDYGCE